MSDRSGELTTTGPSETAPAGSRRRVAAAAGSALFLALVPGTVAVGLPWLLTGWAPGGRTPVLVAVGWILAAAGGVVLLHSFAMFVVRGAGTPAPVAPTERLVVEGMYRHVRNPMYVAVTGVVVGQGLLLGRPVLLVYGVAVWVLMALFARFYEEPALRARFGADHDRYRASVPAWIPRVRPARAPGDRR